MKQWIINKITEYQNEPSLHKTKKCRFTPTCSQYAKECFEKYSTPYASFLAIKRIIKCNPLHKMEYDPVPLERKYRTKYKTLEDTFVDIRNNYKQKK